MKDLVKKFAAVVGDKENLRSLGTKLGNHATNAALSYVGGKAAEGVIKGALKRAVLPYAIGGAVVLGGAAYLLNRSFNNTSNDSAPAATPPVAAVAETPKKPRQRKSRKLDQ